MCDLIFVDGDHTLHGATADLLQMRDLASSNALLLVDDIHAEPGTALNSTLASGKTSLVERYGPYKGGHRYNPCMRSISKEDCLAQIPAFLEGPGRNATNQQKRIWRARCTTPTPICFAWGYAVARYIQ